MKVRYVGMFAEVEIADTGQMVAQGETVEVDDDLGERLLAQETNWKKAGSKSKKED